MTDRPLARFHEGRLWLLDAGAYEPADRFQVTLMREHFLQRTREVFTPSPLSARYAAECNQALEAFAKHEQENA